MLGPTIVGPKMAGSFNKIIIHYAQKGVVSISDNKKQMYVIKLLAKARALLFNDIADLCFHGDLKQCYKELNSLSDKGIIVGRASPFDKRAKYAVLGTKGIQVAQQLGMNVSNTILLPSRAREALLDSQIFVYLCSARIPECDIFARQEAAREFNVLPSRTPMSWAVQLNQEKHAFYRRREQKRSWLLNGILQLDANRSTLNNPKLVPASHAICYHPDLDLSRDRRWLANNASLPKNVHLLRFEDIPAYIKAIQNPLGYAYAMKSALDILAPGGKIYPLDNAPFDHAWDKLGSPLFLADLTTHNISHIQKARDLPPKHFEKWAKGILFLVSTPQEAQIWGRLVEYRPWVWFLVKNTPEGPALYRCYNQQVTPFRTAKEQTPKKEVI